ncbi:MAG TPA: His/Gly/Thr/Pro-type tRNA ligase C-terminal domain-containing protein [Candidatus Omnitrophota bacterium]|nr:His/Gly/Thr/Pro-type tRNA ligase C-terminal domain-containing protein [Candidatus Omnitrophota bacterium]
MPLWLAPTQVIIIPVSERGINYARHVEKVLLDQGIRVNFDARNERLQKKIRDAEMEKIPYMVILGETEAVENSISVRSKAQGDIGKLRLEDFIQMLKREVQEKVR